MLVSRSCVAINAAVFATAIRIQARLETDVGAVVVRDDRFRPVAKELCFATRSVLRHIVAV